MYDTGIDDIKSTIKKTDPKKFTDDMRDSFNDSIMEQTKEEIKNEKNPIIAFDSGYTKSRTTILDANVTTLIAAFILFFMGSGPVKGFSVTLGVGILTTLFSVYFIARLFTSIYVIRNKNKESII